MEAEQRRSGRARKANTRYSTDAFEVAEILDSDAEAAPIRIPDDDDTADEFDAAQEAEEVGEQDDDLSMDEGSDANASDEDDLDAEGEDDDDVDMDVAGSGVGRISHAGFPSISTSNALRRDFAPRSGPKITAQSKGLRQRQLEKEYHKGGFANRMDNYVGRHPEDIMLQKKAYSRWFPIATLPSRKRDRQGCGGMGHSPWFDETAVENEKNEGWKWYDVYGGREAFAKDQRCETISAAEGQTYLPTPYSESQGFLAGPLSKPVLTTLKMGEQRHLSDIWGTGTDNHRRGCVVNLGRRIKKVQWVPNRPQGPQYLCVHVLRHDFSPDPTKATRHHPFQPSEGTKDCLQFWELNTAPNSTYENDENQPPQVRLAMVLCADWGDLKDFEWCPAARDHDTSDTTSIHLGLIATVWGDGHLRVLDLRLPISQTSEPVYLKISSASFSCNPLDTVGNVTCWLSTSAVVLACANGTVYVFSIASNISRMSSPRPFFCHTIHQSYITVLTSGYPSNPHIITTSGMDGYLMVTDIRSPFQDICNPQRARAATSIIAWLDHCQGWIAPDDHCLLRMHAIRRAFSGVYIGRADSSVIAVAASRLHANVLYGSLDGMVQAVNPIRRLMEPRSLTWLQTWFLHEWRRPQPSIPADALERELLAQPLVRFVEGYKPLQCEINQADRMASIKKVKKTRAKKGDMTRVFFTIHEEKTAVTSLAWNNNVEYGGWAAAGMGSGLLRIEDVAV